VPAPLLRSTRATLAPTWPFTRAPPPPSPLQEFKCEICGNASYWGRRAFERHFKEWRHVNGMRALGIPNNKNFYEVTACRPPLPSPSVAGHGNRSPPPLTPGDMCWPCPSPCTEQDRWGLLGPSTPRLWGVNSEGGPPGDGICERRGQVSRKGGLGVLQPAIDGR